MEDIDTILDITRGDDVDDMIPGQTSPVILMTPTSEIFEEISTYFEASQGMLGNSVEASPSTPTESESVEPPVITKVPVSWSHRYRRSRQSDTSASGESGAESASSVYQPVRASATYNNLKRRRKWAFQAIRSPFLEGNGFNTTLPSFNRGSFCSTIQKEAKLKTYAVGGFLKCIRLWHRVNQGRYVKESYLPAVYMDTDEPLSPLSEGDETSDDDGIKIVGNDIFVKSRMKKCHGRQGGMPSSSQTKNQDHVKTIMQRKMSKKVKGHGSLPVNNGSNQAKAGYRPVAVPGSHAMTGRESHRAKGVRGSDPRPVDETASDGKDGPSAPRHPSEPEEEASVASTRPEDPLVIVSTGVGSTLEKSGDLVLRRDPSSDATPVRQVNSPPEVPRTGETISAGTENSTTGWKKPKRKRDKTASYPEDPETNSEAGNPELEKPFSHPADREVGLERDTSETSDVSQRTFDNDTVDVVHKPRKKNREKKRSVTEVGRKDQRLDRLCPAVVTAEVSQRVSVSAISTINRRDDNEEHNRKKRKKENKRIIAEEGEINVTPDEPFPVEFSNVSQPTPGSAITIYNYNNEGNNEEHRKRKKRKNEKKRKLAAGEEIMSLDRPCPVLEPSNISQRTSESTINNNTDDSLDVSGEVKPRKEGKKKKRQTHGVITVEEGNVVGTIFTNKTSTLAEATTVGFTKRKGKTKKRASCPEDPDTNQEVENAVGVNPVAHTADRELEESRRKHRKHKMSETSQYPSCEDILVEGSSLTSACDQKRKRHHSVLSDDKAENLLNAKKKFHASFENRRQDLKTIDDQIGTYEAEPEPVENGGTLTDSLTGPNEIVKRKKKKKKERDALRERGVEDDEVQEGSALDARSSAEPGHEIVKRKRKKKEKEADTESESHLLVEGDTPDDIEAALMKKKYKCKKNTRPEHSGAMPTDSVTISPCSPALDTDATQGGTTANPTADKKKKRNKKKSKSVVAVCDPAPEQT